MDINRRFLSALLIAALLLIGIACTDISIHFGPDTKQGSSSQSVPPEAQSAPAAAQEQSAVSDQNAPAPEGQAPPADEKAGSSLIQLEAAWEVGALDVVEISDLAQFLEIGTETNWAEFGDFPVELLAIPAMRLPTDITGISIIEDIHGDWVVSWYDYGRLAYGSSQELGSKSNFNEKCYRDCAYILPSKKTSQDVIDMAALEMDEILYYYTDGTVSFGIPWIADSIEAQQAFTLPPGKTPQDIVGIDSTCGRDTTMDLDSAVVYAWYRDGTVSSGTYLDLDVYREPYPYILPAGKTIELIQSIAIACTDDHVYVWYWDGTVSSGMTHDLGMYRDPAPFTTP